MTKAYCVGCKILVNTGGLFGVGCNCIEFEEGYYCNNCAEKIVKVRRDRMDKEFFERDREEKSEFKRHPKLKLKKKE